MIPETGGASAWETTVCKQMSEDATSTHRNDPLDLGLAECRSSVLVEILATAGFPGGVSAKTLALAMFLGLPSTVRAISSMYPIPVDSFWWALRVAIHVIEKTGKTRTALFHNRMLACAEALAPSTLYDGDVAVFHTKGDGEEWDTYHAFRGITDAADYVLAETADLDSGEITLAVEAILDATHAAANPDTESMWDAIQNLCHLLGLLVKLTPPADKQQPYALKEHIKSMKAAHGEIAKSNALPEEPPSHIVADAGVYCQSPASVWMMRSARSYNRETAVTLLNAVAKTAKHLPDVSAVWCICRHRLANFPDDALPFVSSDVGLSVSDSGTGILRDANVLSKSARFIMGVASAESGRYPFVHSAKHIILCLLDQAPDYGYEAVPTVFVSEKDSYIKKAIAVTALGLEKDLASRAPVHNLYIYDDSGKTPPALRATLYALVFDSAAPYHFVDEDLAHRVVDAPNSSVKICVSRTKNALSPSVSSIIDDIRAANAINDTNKLLVALSRLLD